MRNPLASSLLLLLACLASRTSCSAPDPSKHNVEWFSPSPFDGKNFADGLPLGNGRVAVLAWPNASAGGVDLYVRSPLALHTDTQVFTLARVSVALSPNPCASGFFSASLHLEDASVRVLCGGSSAADYSVALRVFVDAAVDAVLVTAASRDGAAAFSLSAALSSVRPAERFSYRLDFQCSDSSSGPDVALAWPAAAGVALYHANSVARGDSSLFNETMHQQHLAPLLSQGFRDTLDGRIFGAAMRGAAGVEGDGAALAPVPGSNSTLASAAPAPAFALLVAVRIDPTAGEAVFLRALAAALAVPIAPTARAAGNAAAWGAFWARSYFSPANDPPPPPPVGPPPSAATIGAFPCGGYLASRQTVALDAASGALTLPLGSCFAAPHNGWLDALPCNASYEHWRLVPCTAAKCAVGDFWIKSPAANQVAGFPGAEPPWLMMWTIDDPTGDCSNELFFYNVSDQTLRARNCNSPGACLTVNYTNAPPPPPPSDSLLAAQYARTRFVNAVQGGGAGAGAGVDAPIPFNGMLFTNQEGRGGPADVDYRQWGPNHWFQNTRMPYETMLASGDAAGMRVVLDWVASFIPLLRARTALLLPGESGIAATETVSWFGLYQGGEYGCDGARDAIPGYPPWLEGPGSEGGWVRYDFGGNGFAEAGLMALDYYFSTLDAAGAAKYIPIASNYVDFFASHYRNRTADGRLMIWPSQVLESWWCEWPGTPSIDYDPRKCSQNDLPNVAALRALVRGLLALPPASGLLTPAQRAAYAALEAILPALPLDADGTYSVAQVISQDAGHNSEGPWLYGSHPFRLDTVGAALGASPAAANLSAARATFRRQGWFTANTGWSYGIINAAYLGFAAQAYAMALDRARQPPPPGYRFPAFAQHYQDYEPSADHFSVMNTAVNAMLMQGGEDGDAGSIVLLPAWPCDVDVSFKLWGPLNTSVEVVWAGGALVSIDVEPPERRAAVKFAPCNATERGETFGISHV